MSVAQLSTFSEYSKMNEIKVKFGQRVKELRVSKGYSQEKLAEISDLDRTYIPGIESGKRNVSIIVIAKIAIAFEMDVSELLLNL